MRQLALSHSWLPLCNNIPAKIEMLSYEINKHFHLEFI